jgi:hypothetical protein
VAGAPPGSAAEQTGRPAQRIFPGVYRRGSEVITEPGCPWARIRARKPAVSVRQLLPVGTRIPLKPKAFPLSNPVLIRVHSVRQDKPG